jgi:alpha-glucosidase
MQWLDAPDGMLVLARGQFRCAINFTDEPLPLPPSCAGATLLLSSSATADQGLAELGGNTAAWFLAG